MLDPTMSLYILDATMSLYHADQYVSQEKKFKSEKGVC